MTRYLAGAAVVQVLPSLRGFQKSIAGDLKAIDIRATARVLPVLDRVAVAKVESDVGDLAAKVAKARDKEADAAGRVRVAEQRLQDLRTKGKATTTQLTDAEERLAAAVRASDSAATAAARSVKVLEAAQRRNTVAVDEFEASARRGTSALVKLWQQGEGIDRMSKSMSGARREALALSVGAFQAASGVVAVGSAVPAVAALGGALAGAAGAGLIVPAALATGAVAVGALKIGVSGLGDAMKAAAEGDATKLAEATAGLAGPARAVVGEYVRMRPALDALRLDVQGRLFADVASEVRGLARDYLPIAREGLVGMAGAWNTAAKEAGGFLRQQQTLSDVPLIFDRSTVAVGNLTSATQPLLAILRDVVAVGAIVLADLTGGFGGAAVGAAEFIAQARATGQLEGWIRTGLDTLNQFGQVLGNVGSIFSSVFDAAQAAGGGGLLGTIIQVTGAVAGLLSSAEGQTALTTLFTTVHDVVQNLLPGVQAVAGAILQGVVDVGPLLPDVAEGFSAAAIAVAPLITDLTGLAVEILPPLVDLFKWLAPALPEIAVGFAAGALALKGYSIVSSIIKWYRGWAAAQWALNAAMAVNPIGLIIAAVVGLVAGFVYLWHHSEGFRNFWIGLWDAIKGAALWVWDNALKPAFEGIVTAVKAVGAAAEWLWTTILRPVFDALSFAVRLVAAIIITVLLTPLVLAFKALAAAGEWLWHNALKPVLDAIGAAFSWLWTNVLSPVVDRIKAGIQGWADIFSWLWTTVLSPGLTAIGDAFSWLWTNGVQPVFGFIREGLRVVGEAFSWVWSNVIKPAWDALGVAVAWLWEYVIRPNFEAMKSAVALVGVAFGLAVDYIKSAWDRVYDILSTPIKWIIDVVYNEGIRAVWNKVADLVGLGQLGPIQFGGGSPTKGGRQLAMAGGGVLAGYAPGRDTVPAVLSPGEAVLVPELVRAIGPQTILAANAAASGRPTGGEVGYAGGGVVQRFAGGGIVDSLLGWLPGIGDTVAALWKDPVGFVRNQLGDLGEWATLLAKTPATLIGSGAEWLWGQVKGFFGFSSDQAASAAGAAGGRPQGWQQMWEIIRAQFPSAILTSDYRAGDPGYHGKGRAIDIGGPMGAINSWIAKVYPNSTQLIYTPGANILNGRPFTYDAPTQSDHFDHVHWAFDQGGYLPPGYTSVYNGTGRPEAVFTEDQLRGMGQQSGGVFTGDLYLDSGEFLGKVRGEVRSELDSTGTAVLTRRRT